MINQRDSNESAGAGAEEDDLKGYIGGDDKLLSLRKEDYMCDVSCTFDKFENLVLGAMCQLVGANNSVQS